MNDDTTFTLVVVAAIGLFINYLIIKGAVSSALKPLQKKKDQQIMLLRAIAEKLNAPVDKYQQIENEKEELRILKQKLINGNMRRSKYNEIKSRVAELEAKLK